MVQKPKGPNTYGLKIWLWPSGNHGDLGVVDVLQAPVLEAVDGVRPPILLVCMHGMGWEEERRGKWARLEEIDVSEKQLGARWSAVSPPHFASVPK